jgi:hypothetical protein
MATATKAAKAATVLVREFSFERDTKGAVRFKQDDEPHGKRSAIGTLYLTKEAVAAELPADFKRIRVTVEAI